MSYLLDVSSLLALLWENHLSHARVQTWARAEELAVCPITELGFLRISTQSFGADMDDARQSLSAWLMLNRKEYGTPRRGGIWRLGPSRRRRIRGKKGERVSVALPLAPREACPVEFGR